MRALFLAASFAFLMACGPKAGLKRLDQEEFKHYYALKVFMKEEAEKDYLKLKTREERDAWLKEKKLWDRFYKLDPAVREQIYTGDVQVGWTKEMVLMSWGRPVDTKTLAGRQAVRSFLLVYRFEQDQEGNLLVWEPGSKTQYKAQALYIREIVLDDEKVAEIRQKPGKW